MKPRWWMLAVVAATLLLVTFLPWPRGTAPVTSGGWRTLGPGSIRIERLEMVTAESYRPYSLPPDWLIRLSRRIPWLRGLRPPVGRIDPPAPGTAPVVAEMTLTAPLYPSEMTFWLDLGEDRIRAAGGTWEQMPGELFVWRLSSR